MVVVTPAFESVFWIIDSGFSDWFWVPLPVPLCCSADRSWVRVWSALLLLEEVVEVVELEVELLSESDEDEAP